MYTDSNSGYFGNEDGSTYDDGPFWHVGGVAHRVVRDYADTTGTPPHCGEGPEDAEEQLRLGRRYERGIGVAQDYAQAAYWYTRAAEQDHEEALHYLGMLYEYGRAVDRDVARALSLYRRAEAGGFCLAGYRAARLEAAGAASRPEYRLI